MSIYFLKHVYLKKNELCSQLFSVPFFLKAATCFLHILLLFFHDRYFRGMTISLPTHPPKSPHPSHTNADDQILMKSDFVMDFQSLSSRDSTVWKRGCDNKMSPKMKKATFGFQNRTDLFKRPTRLSRSPGSTWSFCSGGLSLHLGHRWHPLVHQLCSQGSSATANSRSSQLAFISKGGPQRMFAEWINEWMNDERMITEEVRAASQTITTFYHATNTPTFLLVQRSITYFQLGCFYDKKIQKRWESVLRWYELNSFFVLPHYIRDYKGKV